MDVDDDILVVTIDAPGAPVNTLSPALVGEFEDVFRRVQDDSLIKGVVLISGKPDGFIAGADIEQFPALKTAAAAEAISRMGQELLHRLELLRVPVVAAIHGACLGGGLETGARLSLSRVHRSPEDDVRASGGSARTDSGNGRHAASAAARWTAGRARHDSHRPKRARETRAANGSRRRDGAPGDSSRDRNRARAGARRRER